MSNILSITKQHNRSLGTSTSDVGQFGEEFAAQFLQKNGYRIVLTNFKVPIGRNRKGVAVTGEIDLIALDDDRLCFVEVKTRRSDIFASPLSAVDLRKQRQIIRTARMYRKIFHLVELNFRYDVISVLIDEGNHPKAELFKGYWTENRFRKRYWSGEF